MEYLENLTNQIMMELNDKPWNNEFEQGHMSIRQIWNNITSIVESKDLDPDILKDFYDKDLEIIEEIIKIIKKEFRRNGVTELNDVWEIEMRDGFLSMPRINKELNREDLRDVFGVGGTFLPRLKKQLLELLKTRIRASLDNNFIQIMEEDDII